MGEVRSTRKSAPDVSIICDAFIVFRPDPLRIAEGGGMSRPSIRRGCGGRNAAHRRVHTSIFLTGSVSPRPCQFVRLSCSHSDSSSGRSMIPAYRIGVGEGKGGGGNASARCAPNSDGQEQEFPILVYLSTVRWALIPREPHFGAFVRKLHAEICAETIQIQVQGIHEKNTVLQLTKSILVPLRRPCRLGFTIHGSPR